MRETEGEHGRSSVYGAAGRPWRLRTQGKAMHLAIKIIGDFGERAFSRVE